MQFNSVVLGPSNNICIFEVAEQVNKAREEKDTEEGRKSRPQKSRDINEVIFHTLERKKVKFREVD